MLVLASHADKDRWDTYAGQQLLAAEAEVSERTVRQALLDLESAGLIRRKKRYGRTRGRTSDLIVLERSALELLPAAVAASSSPDQPADVAASSLLLPATLADLPATLADLPATLADLPAAVAGEQPEEQPEEHPENSQIGQPDDMNRSRLVGIVKRQVQGLMETEPPLVYTFRSRVKRRTGMTLDKLYVEGTVEQLEAVLAE